MLEYPWFSVELRNIPEQALLKVTLKKNTNPRVGIVILVGPRGLEPVTKGLCLLRGRNWSC